MSNKNFTDKKTSTMNIINKLTDIGGGEQIPERIIIHAMSEKIRLNEKYKDTVPGIYPAAQWLEELGLSAHYLINIDGSITKLRNSDQVAWHAKGHNQDTIGIEVLVPGIHTYETFKETIAEQWVNIDQYNTLVEWTVTIMNYWGIPVQRVLRHSDIDPKRKIDPGKGFPWEEFIHELKQKVR